MELWKWVAVAVALLVGGYLLLGLLAPRPSRYWKRSLSLTAT